MKFWKNLGSVGHSLMKSVGRVFTFAQDLMVESYQNFQPDTDYFIEHPFPGTPEYYKIYGGPTHNKKKEQKALLEELKDLREDQKIPLLKVTEKFYVPVIGYLFNKKEVISPYQAPQQVYRIQHNAGDYGTCEYDLRMTPERANRLRA